MSTTCVFCEQAEERAVNAEERAERFKVLLTRAVRQTDIAIEAARAFRAELEKAADEEIALRARMAERVATAACVHSTPICGGCAADLILGSL